ncbi:MAG: hypothetical protein HXS47_00175 [Theionarchaea archaeon]|nr:hypothetical protein [Theionarchaea archaeon]
MKKRELGHIKEAAYNAICSFNVRRKIQKIPVVDLLLRNGNQIMMGVTT